MLRRDRISVALCATALAVAVFCVGGAPRWAQAAVALVSALGLVASARSRRVFVRVPPLLALLFTAAGLTALQLVPLPAALVESLSPTLAALRVDGHALAGVDAASTISMDPSATLRGLTFLLTLTGVAVVALRVSTSESGRFQLIAAVGAVTGATAILCGIHELLAAKELFGLYKPMQRPVLLGPLLNTNHLGGLMAIGAVINAGLALHPRQKGLWRLGWTLAGIACVVAATATYSRGAVVGLGAGLLVMCAALIAQRLFAADQEEDTSRRRRERFLATTLPVGVIVVCTLVVAVYLGAGSVMQQLQGTRFAEVNAPRTKFAAWKSSAVLAKEAPYLGVGRGAFESAFTRVHPGSAFATFSHPENEAVQAIVEWGVGGALVLAVLAGLAVLLAMRRWRDGPIAAGGLGALMVVAFQSNFDFGMELLGLAVPVVVIFSTLTYVPLKEAATAARRKALAVRAAHGALILVGGIMLLLPWTRAIHEDHETIQTTPTLALIKESIQKHPLDYLGYSEYADLVATSDPQLSVRLLNHALRLHPTHPGLHWVAARLLLRMGHVAQAESEYTTAIRYSTNPRKLFEEVIRGLPRDVAARTIPLDLPVDATANVLMQIDMGAALAWLDRVTRYRFDHRAAEVLYVFALRAKNYELAEVGARRRCDAMPNAQCRLDLVRVLLAQNKHQEIVDVLADVADWHGQTAVQFQSWLARCDAFETLGKRDDARECLRRLNAAGIAPPDSTEITRRLEATRPPKVPL